MGSNANAAKPGVRALEISAACDYAMQLHGADPGGHILLSSGSWEGGKPVTSFSLASSRSWVSSDGERRKETEWFNVVAWGNLAEICNQHLSRDQQVYIEGRLQTRSWEDGNGQRHFRTEVVANEMIILGSRTKYSHSPQERGDDSTENDHF